MSIRSVVTPSEIARFTSCSAVWPSSSRWAASDGSRGTIIAVRETWMSRAAAPKREPLQRRLEVAPLLPLRIDRESHGVALLRDLPQPGECGLGRRPASHRAARGHAARSGSGSGPAARPYGRAAGAPGSRRPQPASLRDSMTYRSGVQPRPRFSSPQACDWNASPSGLRTARRPMPWRPSRSRRRS